MGLLVCMLLEEIGGGYPTHMSGHGFFRILFLALYRSTACYALSQNSGEVPKAEDSLSAISALMEHDPPLVVYTNTRVAFYVCFIYPELNIR
jgi:hypothetical protein